MTEYAGKETTVSKPIIEFEYPNGVEYKCEEGFTLDGSAAGATKITSKVTSQATLDPALPAKCTQVTFSIAGQVVSARSGKSVSDVKVSVGDVSATTSKNGFFSLEGVIPGKV